MSVLPTPVVRSNLFTMGVTAKTDPLQEIPSKPTHPSPEVAKLRAKLIFEEAMETIIGLGVSVYCGGQNGYDVLDNTQFEVVRVMPLNPPEGLTEIALEEIIDGCCDTIYVAVGTMLACGVDPDAHLEEVCRANDAKFPGGVATTIEGKFQKPPGWTPPDHISLFSKTHAREPLSIDEVPIDPEEAQHRN